MNSSNNVIIAPSILACDPGKYSEEIKSVAAAGADWIHIDVMDGSFVPSITFGDNVVRCAKKACSLLLDVHLMIVNPDAHLNAFKEAGADRIIVHQETCPHLHRTLGAINGLGIKSGVAVNPGTPVESIFEVLEICDLALVMTVNPGWGGQKFLSTSLRKIETLKAEIEKRKLSTIIEVDGGVNVETAKLCVKAGARALVAGSSVFGQSDRAKAIAALR